MDIFREIAFTNDWGAICPEICLVVGGLVLLVMDFCLPRYRDRVAGVFSMVVFMVALVMLAFEWAVPSFMVFGGMIEHSGIGWMMRMFFVISGLMVVYLGDIYLKRMELARVEFFHLLLIVTAGMMVLVQARHFLMFFVALETVTVGLFVMVSYCRSSSLSLEGGLKYLVMGGLSSALLLFGIMLLYGAAGNVYLGGSSGGGLDFESLRYFINVNTHNSLVVGGVVLVVSGVLFKIGAVPFQIWIPDVYQGAPTPVTAFLAVSSKAAGVFVLVNLVSGPFASMAGLLIPLLSVVAMVTILFGNITALPQRNVKRLMGLSGVSHGGFLLMGVVAFMRVEWALGAIMFYLFTYMLGTFAVFSVMSHREVGGGESDELEGYEGFGKKNPLLGMGLVVGLGSLAGIPPLAGFIGKLFIFIVAFQAKLYLLIAVGVVGVVISIYYYFGWIRDAFFFVVKGNGDGEIIANAKLDSIVLSRVNKLVIGFIMFLILFFGLFQWGLGGLLG